MCRRCHTYNDKNYVFFPFCFPFLLLEADLKKIDDVKSQLVGFFFIIYVCAKAMGEKRSQISDPS